jgi:hypothetical protein
LGDICNRRDAKYAELTQRKYNLCESFAPSVPLWLFNSKFLNKKTSNDFFRSSQGFKEIIYNRKGAKSAEIAQRQNKKPLRILSDLCASATSWPPRGGCLILKFNSTI